MTNAYVRLREDCLARATKPFTARGFAVKRCARCQLGVRVCICPWRVETTTDTDVLLLMHRDELFKPTNTGRLIADLFPRNTYAFEWSRTRPSAELLSFVQDHERYPVIVFPPDELNSRHVYTERPTPAQLSGRRLTLIMLDGTWKQARKMYKTSRWLQGFPLQALPAQRTGEYAVRQAAQAGHLSTAEAAADILSSCNEPLAAELLADYFAVFNLHYLATRLSISPDITDHHRRLAHRVQPTTGSSM